MLVSIPSVLDAGQLVRARRLLDEAEWIDGRSTAGVQSSLAKRNQQLPQEHPAAREIGDLWPRPVLVIHGKGDRIIAFEHGQELYDAALQPKYHYWVDRGDHNDVVADPVVSKAVLLFFDNARSII